MTPFDRRVLDAYLIDGHSDQPARAQRIVRRVGLPLTSSSLARVLRALVRLERAARTLHTERTTP
ncbi:MAG: hypothetical protein ACRD3G_12225 [Vicinamibacterales bacterium]